MGLGKYLMISKDELRNNEKDWMVTKWLKHKLYELYGVEKTNQILHSNDPQWSEDELDEATQDSVLEAVRIADPTRNPLSVVAKRFLW